MAPHLTSVARKPSGAETDGTFPFSVPAIRLLERLDLDAAVTFFVGENGSGKSTLLEGIAAAAGLPTVGAADVAADETLAAQRRLGLALRLAWRHRTARGFFLRAEDFFGFARRLARERGEMLARLRELEEEYRAQDRSAHALGLAQGPLRAVGYEELEHVALTRDFLNHPESYLRRLRQ